MGPDRRADVGDPRRHPYRWVLFGGVCAVYFAFGVVAMSVPPLVGEVRDDLGLSRSAMGLALGAWQLVYIVSAPIGGRLLDRLGIHRGILLGSAVVAASGFARAAADGLGSFLAVVTAAGLWWVLSGRAPEPPVAVHGTDAAAAAGRSGLLADSEFRLVLVLGLGVFFIGHGLGGWMPQVLREHSGFSPMAAANWVALGSLVGVAASLVVPRRTDRPRLPATLVVMLVVIAVGLVEVFALPTVADPVPVALAGLRSALVPLVLVALLECGPVRPANIGVASGLWFAVAEVGGVSGPLVMGWVADSSAGFGGALLLMAGVCVLMLVPVARLRRFTG